jgi:hypothetical protein
MDASNDEVVDDANLRDAPTLGLEKTVGWKACTPHAKKDRRKNKNDFMIMNVIRETNFHKIASWFRVGE